MDTPQIILSRMISTIPLQTSSLKTRLIKKRKYEPFHAIKEKKITQSKDKRIG